MNPRHRRSPRNLTLNKAYPEWYDSKGVFSGMVSAPWSSDVDLSSIDIAYHGEHSGGKFVAPLLYYFVDDDGEITTEGYAAISDMLLNRYGAKWDHLWGLYSLEYGVLNSYNLVETRHREASNLEERDNTHTVQRTDTHNHPTKTVELESTRTPDLEESTTVDEDTTRSVDETTTVTHGHVVTTDNDTTESVADSKHGFNSADAVPTDSSASTGTSDTTETHSGADVTVVDSDETATKDGTTVKATTGTEDYSETETERYTGTDSLVKTGSETDAMDGSSSEEEDISSTKTGNIFKSPAELMMADRDFWLTDFFSIVFEDVDQMLTLSIYPEREIRHLVLE